MLDAVGRRRDHDRPRRPGRPGLFREIEHYLNTGEHLPPARVRKFTPFCKRIWRICTASTALKPVSASPQTISPGIPRGLVGSAAFRHAMNQLPTLELQRSAVNDFFRARRTKRAPQLRRDGTNQTKRRSQPELRRQNQREADMARHNDISICVTGALEKYFRDLDGEMPCAIYDMVAEER